MSSSNLKPSYMLKIFHQYHIFFLILSHPLTYHYLEYVPPCFSLVFMCFTLLISTYLLISSLSGGCLYSYNYGHSNNYAWCYCLSSHSYLFCFPPLLSWYAASVHLHKPTNSLDQLQPNFVTKFNSKCTFCIVVKYEK